MLRRIQITIIAIMITSTAATTGTTKFKLDRMMRIVSSAVISGILRVGGAMVPETTNQSEYFPVQFFCVISRLMFISTGYRDYTEIEYFHKYKSIENQVYVYILNKGYKRDGH